MSGILAVVRTDGAPVDQALVQGLITSPSMALRGPDGQFVWHRGPVGLGHSLLRTTFEAESDAQPLSLDGHTWIVADGRVDARDELIAALDGPQREMKKAADSELMLRAYLKWGQGCVDHLIGDFAFCVWDEGAQTLFCARDHMGVKPFYFVHKHPWLLVSSTIECLRLHSAVSDTLNDLAIADFLLFACNQEPSTTSFHDIARLPGAHTLTWSGGALAVRRYWTMPMEEPLHYRRKRDYLDQFAELTRTAVFERLRARRVSVLMSGGLDSTNLAAVSKGLLVGGTEPAPVHAFTYVYKNLIASDEDDFAAAAAAHLQIPIASYVLDERPEWDYSACAVSVEPTTRLLDATPNERCYRAMEAHSRIAFYGEGPDNAMNYEIRPYLAGLLSQRRWGRVVYSIASYLRHHRHVPSVSSLLRVLRNTQPCFEAELGGPAWLSASLVQRLALEERWHTIWNPPASLHPIRPRGYASLKTAQWLTLFESLEPSYTKVSMEVRHPYVDVRVLRFLLRVPPLPWCRDKYLMREHLRGKVPESVRLRPKTPLSSSPSLTLLTRQGRPTFVPGELMARFVDALPDSMEVQRQDETLRSIALSHWLKGLSQA